MSSSISKNIRKATKTVQSLIDAYNKEADNCPRIRYEVLPSVITWDMLTEETFSLGKCHPAAQV